MISKEDYKEYLKEWQSRITSSMFAMLDAKLQLLPLISTISVAVLALLSTNGDLISNPSLFRMSMILFICVIPLSLWFSFLTINTNLNALMKSEPLSFDYFEKDEIKKRLEQIEKRAYTSKLIKLICNNIKDGKFKEAKINLWQLVYGTAPFFLIVILTIAFILFVISLSFSFNPLQREDDLAGLPCYKGEGIATIEIRGEVIPYFLYTTDKEKIDDPDAYDAVSSEEVVACIDNIKNDDNMEGIVVEIDSGGGSPFASEEIMNALKRLTKPTVAVIRERATSGAYLIASAADRIFASAFSDIGGIGVTMSYLDYSQKNEADGITYQQISSGKFKDTGDPDKPLSDEEWDLLMRDTELMHAMFTANVAKNRSLDIKKVIELADGSSMLGEMAKENGLIDEIGDRNSAENWLNSRPVY